MRSVHFLHRRRQAILAVLLAAPLACVTISRAQPLLVDSVACAPMPPVLPDTPPDFHVVYAGGDRIEVDASGKATRTLQRLRWGRPPETIRTDARLLDHAAIRQLYATILACRFFDLDPHYFNKNVLDGVGESMTVTSNGATHSVSVYYYRVERFRTIAAALGAALK